MLSHHERKNMAISKSGLPQKVLELFDPREDLPYLPPIIRKKPKLPMMGIAPFVGHFPGPEDPAYAPAKSAVGQQEDRKFRCIEYAAQVSIEQPSIVERCVQPLSQTLCKLAILPHAPQRPGSSGS